MTTRHLLPIAVLALTCAFAPSTAFAQDKPQSPSKATSKATSAAKQSAQPTGITWFGTWEQALAEAKRSNRPILFTSAAPACGTVPGMW